MEGDLYKIGYNLRSSISETLSDDRLIIFLRGHFDKTGYITKKTILKNRSFADVSDCKWIFGFKAISSYKIMRNFIIGTFIVFNIKNI